MSEADGVRVADAPDEHRYEARLGDELAGFVEYRAIPGALILSHTEVDPAYEGRGVGSRLAKATLDDVRTRGLDVVPRCPFIAAYIERHPEYADLIRNPSRP